MLAGLGMLLVGGAGLASGASITLTGPQNGTTIPTTGRTTSAILSWQADTTGCQSSLTGAVPRISGPIPVVGQSVTGAPPSGANLLTFVNSRPKRVFRWYVAMNCLGVGEVRSETRTFTIQGANPNPRIAGKHRVMWGKTPQTWTFWPTCKRGACNTRVKIPGVPRFVLKYNARSRTYNARVGGGKGARAAVCTDRGHRPVVSQRLQGMVPRHPQGQEDRGRRDQHLGAHHRRADDGEVHAYPAR